MSDPLTDADLDAILARADAATQAPWSNFGPYVHDATLEAERIATAKSRHDATFIAAARTDVPRLVRELRKARRSREGWMGGHEFDEDVNDASMCMCGLPALDHDALARRDDGCARCGHAHPTGQTCQAAARQWYAEQGIQWESCHGAAGDTGGTP